MDLQGLKVEIDRNIVYSLLDLNEESPVYEEVVSAYEELLPVAAGMMVPQGRIGFGELCHEVKNVPLGSKVAYVLVSLGQEIGSYCSRLMEEGNYLEGMLVDAMADSCLFNLEKQWQPVLKQACAGQRLGVRARIAIPQEIPMKVQETVCRALHGEEIGVGITSGYMLSPVKTTCEVFALTDDETVFESQHDCSKCENTTCKIRWMTGGQKKPVEHRGVNVTVEGDDSIRTIVCQRNESLLEALNREGYYVPAICGSKGHCGKCGIQVLKGNIKVNTEDRRFFSEETIAAGVRLSCLAYPEEDCTIRLLQGESSGFEIVDAYESPEKSKNEMRGEDGEGRYGIAVDIGTTTIAMQCIDISNGAVVRSESSINHQRMYGADVISRMEASNHGKKKELQELIRKDLNQMLDHVLDQLHGKPQLMVIGANTTMIHLLMGYSCETLGVAPFLPVNLEMISGSAAEILGRTDLDMHVRIIPGISTYVGADIVSGIYACGMHKKEEITLLIDLGTNGEMAIGNSEKILVTSTAAGPAFEGGNISWGTGSIPGAISQFHIEADGKKHIETIMGQDPCGICGTGVIDMIAELVRTELVDETGLLDDAYFETGYPVAENSKKEKIIFTQKDVREIQLAKAAVRAGMETLLRRYGTGYEEISSIYIAGGFGFRLDKHMAVLIGMLPEELEEKTTAIGNSSLAGAGMALRDEDAFGQMEHIVGISSEVGLAADKEFNQFYMDYMYFDT